MHTEAFIRPTSRADLDTIGRIAEATGLFSPSMLGEMIAGYLGATNADIWLTATVDDQPVAFGFCEPERMTAGTWNLLAIGVVPDHQGEGVGGRLVKHLEGILAEAGHRLLLVETASTGAFARTRSFYLSSGFVEEARVREFYEAGVDKVIFRKHL